MWVRYINNNHPILDSSLVDAVMFHHATLYDPTLQHVYLDGKVNAEVVYNNFVKGNNASNLHWYQVQKKGDARNYNTVKTGCFWSKRLYNNFYQKIGLEAHFESSDDEIDTKDDRTTNTNIR